MRDVMISSSFVTHSVEHASEEFIHLPVLVAWPLTAVVKLVFLARLLDEWQLHALMLFSICLHTLDCVQKMCMNVEHRILILAIVSVLQSTLESSVKVSDRVKAVHTSVNVLAAVHYIGRRRMRDVMSSLYPTVWHMHQKNSYTCQY